jgi:hypothetical protein
VDGDNPNGTPDAAITTSPDGGPSPATGDGELGPVDVCAMLTDEEAVEVATVQGLNSDPSAKYSVEKEKQEYPGTVLFPPLGGCKFLFYSETSSTPRSFNGAAVIEVTDAESFDFYKGAGATPVAGIGDEAVTQLGSTVVRVGDVMMSTGENSFTDAFVIEMYRRMADDLR